MIVRVPEIVDSGRLRIHLIEHESVRAFDLFREPDTEHALEGRQGLPERLHGEVGVGIPFAVVAVFIERIIDELAELEDHSGQVRLELLRRVFRRDGERAQDPTAGDMTDPIRRIRRHAISEHVLFRDLGHAFAKKRVRDRTPLIGSKSS